MDNRSADRIGRRGERKFEDLCELAGLSVSELQPDMTAKDRLVEFPFNELTGDLTYDTRPSPRSCYVQVKTLLKNNDRVRMRLSAAERLARDLKPTFICVLRLDANDDFVDMHLVHIHDKVLEAILKRLRAETARGSKNLNRKMITFGISAGRKVDIVGRATCCPRDDIGDDMHAYSRRKEAQLKDLGYDARRVLLNIQFLPLRPDQIVNGFLGLQELPVTKLQSFERRFDIVIPSGPHGHSEPESQTIRVTPTPLDGCTITFQSADRFETATLEGDLYGPPPLGLPAQFAKFVVRANLLDVSVCHDFIDVKTNVDFPKRGRHPLKVWVQTFQALNILARGGCEITLHTKRLDRDFRMPRLSEPDTPMDTWWLNYAIDVLTSGVELRQLAKSQDTPINISEFFQSGKNVKRAHALMKGNDQGLTGGFTATAKELVTIDVSQALLIDWVSVGEEKYAFALRATATPQVEGSFVRWTATKFNPLTIEQLGGDAVADYLSFRNRIATISGIKLVVQRSLDAND